MFRTSVLRRWCAAFAVVVVSIGYFSVQAVAQTTAAVDDERTAVRRAVEFERDRRWLDAIEIYEKSLKALSAVWNSLSALLSWPRAENLVVVLFSRRASCASLGAFSALTIALTMLSISIPEPTPVIPTMLNTSSLC